MTKKKVDASVEVVVLKETDIVEHSHTITIAEMPNHTAFIAKQIAAIADVGTIDEHGHLVQPHKEPEWF